MSRARKIFFLFLFLSLISGCKFKNKKELGALEFCRQLNIDYCGKNVVMIPSMGCGSCISAAIDFLKLHGNSNNHVFVFVEIGDKKRVRFLLNGYMNESKIHLDTLKLSRKYGLSSEYPVVLKTNHCEIEEVIIAGLNNKRIWEAL